MMPKKPKAKITEKDITKAIRQVLGICGIFHWKQWQGPMSQPSGVSDIIGIFKGRFLAIEVKKPGGKLTANQAVFLERISREGGIAFVAYGVDDVITRLGLQEKFI